MPELRVLIVDDHEGFREAARQLLEWRGYRVVGEASSAEEALEAAKRLEPDGILLDVHLGAEDGYEVARTLFDVGVQAAILMVSDTRDQRGEERAHEAGAAGFSRKLGLYSVDLEGVLIQRLRSTARSHAH